MPSVWRSFCFAAPLVVAACGYDEPGPSLRSVTPDRAYNDDTIALVLAGGTFRPGLAIDTGSGSVAVGGNRYSVTLVAADGRLPAMEGSWRGPGEIDATIPAGIPGARYDVELRDPRGHVAVLPGGFTGLGADRDPPRVTIDDLPASGRTSPRSSVTGRISVDDGVGHVLSIAGWASSETLDTVMLRCDPVSGGPPRASCPFVFFAPPSAVKPTEVITITATGTDVNGNQGTASTSIEVLWLPVVATISPELGPTAGGTAIEVRGSSFIAGVSQILIDGQPIQPNGGTVVSDQLIVGTTGPHPPGSAGVVVANGPGKSAPARAFEFVAPPVLRAIDPRSGPTGGETRVQLAGSHFRPGQTTVAIIDGDGTRLPLSDVTVTSDHMINVNIPPGSGVLSIAVVDPVSGESVLPNAFSYTADAPPPQGGPPP